MSDGRQKDPRCRQAIHVGQFSHCPLQFSRPFHHLHLKFVAGFANFLLSPAPFMNQIRAAEGCRRMIHSHSEQHPVSFGREVATLTADGDKTGAPDQGYDTDIYTALLGGLVNQQLANDPGGQRWRRLIPRVISMFADDLGLP